MDTRPSAKTETPLSVLLFEVAGAWCALPVAQVREVLSARAPEPVPGASACLEGIIRVRGTVVPVVNVCKRFGWSSASSATSLILLVQFAGILVGMQIDRVDRVVDVPPSTIQLAATMAETRLGSRYADGFLELDGRLVTLVNLDAVFSGEDLQRMLPTPPAA